MSNHKDTKEFSHFRERLYEIIFEADTPAGKTFDILLLVAILGSVLAVMLETVPAYDKYHTFFIVLEWIFTIFFTIEYITRIYTCLLYTSPSPRDKRQSRMPSSA